jgi:hypothetical protein
VIVCVVSKRGDADVCYAMYLRVMRVGDVRGAIEVHARTRVLTRVRFVFVLVFDILT